jgi:hypothetical protein
VPEEGQFALKSSVLVPIGSAPLLLQFWTLRNDQSGAFDGTLTNTHQAESALRVLPGKPRGSQSPTRQLISARRACEARPSGLARLTENAQPSGSGFKLAGAQLSLDE